MPSMTPAPGRWRCDGHSVGVIVTVDYARGQTPPAEWAAAPGIEPMWLLWLHTHDSDALPVARQDLDDVETALTRSVPAPDSAGRTS